MTSLVGILNNTTTLLDAWNSLVVKCFITTGEWPAKEKQSIRSRMKLNIFFLMYYKLLNTEGILKPLDIFNILYEKLWISNN